MVKIVYRYTCLQEIFLGTGQQGRLSGRRGSFPSAPKKQMIFQNPAVRGVSHTALIRFNLNILRKNF